MITRNKFIIMICTATICGHIFTATTDAATRRKSMEITPDKTVLLYPEGQNVDKGISENGKAITLGPGESNGINGPEKVTGNGKLSEISDSARIDIYLPEKPNGQMIVVCPGGGYHYVSSFNEGKYVADWCLKQNIAVCVVKYRLPNGHWTVPLTDVQNAFRYCRHHADEWGIKQIGIMGFSAGGHLAASASTLFVDNLTRPDFSVLVYPVINMSLSSTHRGTHDRLIGKESKWLDETMSMREYCASKEKYDELMEHYSLDKQISENTPPTILLLSSDDGTVPPVNSYSYADGLRKHNVEYSMFVFPIGGHGWGFTTPEFGEDSLGTYRTAFFETLKAWLEAHRPVAE